MKRLLAALFLALVGALVVASGVASADPKQDLVSGTGQKVRFPEEEFDAQFHVNATSGPTGEDPRGHFFFTRSISGIEDLDFSGQVTCVNVKGGRAAVAGLVTKSKNPSMPEGTAILFGIVDRGPSAEDEASVFKWFFLDECPFTSTDPLAKGNFVVHDATP
jgi:hypothetical protein